MLLDYNCASASSGTKIRYATQNNICDGNGGWSVETGTVSIGGVTHKTVELAGMTILAENVKTSTSSSSCFEGNNNHSCTHGRLYTYAEASTICPTGWHLLDSAADNPVSLTVAPLILVVAYVVIIPIGILFKGKKQDK